MGGAGPRATPVIENDRVYTQTATGQVACIDVGTSKVLWQADLLEIGGWDKAASELAIAWGRSGSPLLTGPLMVVPLGAPNGTADRGLIAFDKQTGEVRWRAGDDQISYASPSLTKLLDKEQIVIVNEATVTGHEIDSGKVLWSIPWDGHSNSSANCSQTITVSPNQMLISKGYSQGSKLVEFSIDAQGQWSTKTLWEETNVLKTKFTNAVVLGEYAYALSDGLLECAKVADGKRKWKGRGYGHGQLLLVGDKLLIMAEQGDLALVDTDPRQFKQLARVPAISGVTWNVPSLSGDRLLIRNSDEAACIKLPLLSGVAP
jgi:outer membrane protein assembly factor BamB